jgi:hypothetical protein
VYEKHLKKNKSILGTTYKCLEIAFTTLRDNSRIKQKRKQENSNKNKK